MNMIIQHSIGYSHYFTPSHSSLTRAVLLLSCTFAIDLSLTLLSFRDLPEGHSYWLVLTQIWRAPSTLPASFIPVKPTRETRRA